MNYMAIDQHKQYLHLTLMDEESKVLKSCKVGNYRCEMQRFF